MEKVTKNPPHVETLSAIRPCLNVPQVASILGISRSRAYQLAHSDGFPKIVMGKRLIIPHAAFLSWMQTHTVTRQQSDMAQ